MKLKPPRAGEPRNSSAFTKSKQLTIVSKGGMIAISAVVLTYVISQFQNWGLNC